MQAVTHDSKSYKDTRNTSDQDNGGQSDTKESTEHKTEKGEITVTYTQKMNCVTCITQI